MAKLIPKLYAEVSGSGPVVVLLHGIFSSTRYWSKVRRQLEVDHMVVAIDLLGFGKSPKPRNSSYDYDEHISAINRTLDGLGIHEPFILVGHSMGALLALRYSTMYEHKVERLVLTNMPVMLGKQEVRREILGTSRLYRFGLGRGVNRLTWPLIRGLYSLRILPSRIHANLSENDYFFQHTAISRMRSFYNIIAGARVDIDFARLQVKTTMLTGLNDRAIYLENIVRRLTLGPNVHHVKVATGHHIPCSSPDILIRQVTGSHS